MDIYRTVVRGTVTYQTEDGETLLTGTEFRRRGLTYHFTVENSDGLFEFRVEPVRPPGRSLLARLFEIGVYRQGTAADASSGKKIRVTQPWSFFLYRTELIAEDLDTGITVTGRVEPSPRRWFPKDKHVLRSSLGNSIVMDRPLTNRERPLFARRPWKTCAFEGERAADWNLLFLTLFAYCTMMTPHYNLAD